MSGTTSVTHHANNPTALANYTAVNRWLVSQYVYALSKMDKSVMVQAPCWITLPVFASANASDGDSHSNQNMPVLLAGSAGGKLQTGRAIVGGGAIEQVHVSLLQAMGLTTQKFRPRQGTTPWPAGVSVRAGRNRPAAVLDACRVVDHGRNIRRAPPHSRARQSCQQRAS